MGMFSSPRADEKIPAYIEKAQSDRDYRDYLEWKRERTRGQIDRRVRRTYRPIRTKDFCKGRYEVEGKKMAFEWLAKREARISWERVARVRESEQFSDWEYAADKDIVCWKVGGFKRCKATGIACRP
jgi:hypothetical protein